MMFLMKDIEVVDPQYGLGRHAVLFRFLQIQVQYFFRKIHDTVFLETFDDK